MSLSFVDVGKIRERAEHEAKLERAVESKKISKQATLETAGGPLSGFFKGKTAVQPRAAGDEPYVFTEYTDGLTALLGKVLDHSFAGAGKIEDDLSRSQDIRESSVQILGGGTTNPYIGLAGACFSTISRHKAEERMAAKPAPKPAPKAQDKGKAKVG